MWRKQRMCWRKKKRKGLGRNAAREIGPGKRQEQEARGQRPNLQYEKREGGGGGTFAACSLSPTNQMLRRARLFFLLTRIFLPVDCWSLELRRMETAIIRGRAPPIHGVLGTSAQVLMYLARATARRKIDHELLLPPVPVLEDEDPGPGSCSVAPASSLLIGGDHGEMSKIRANLHWPGADPNHWDFDPIGGDLMQILCTEWPSSCPPFPSLPLRCRLLFFLAPSPASVGLQCASHRWRTKPPAVLTVEMVLSVRH